MDVGIRGKPAIANKLLLPGLATLFPNYLIRSSASVGCLTSLPLHLMESDIASGENDWDSRFVGLDK
jgi:hypothetical protein